MTLFEDQAQGDFERAVALVEQTIRALGIDASEVRRDDPDGSSRFSLRRGSASILVTLTPPGSGRDGTLRVVAPIVRVPSPDRHAEMFRRLLELNARELVGVAFGIVGDDVVLVAERTVRDLDASEVDAMIRSVGRDADRYDDALSQQFATTRSSDPRP